MSSLNRTYRAPRRRWVGAAFSVIAVATALLSALPARAEGKISIAQQFGIGYLILDVVRDRQLIEKHGKQQGIDIQAVSYTHLTLPTILLV